MLRGSLFPLRAGSRRPLTQPVPPSQSGASGTIMHGMRLSRPQHGQHFTGLDSRAGREGKNRTKSNPAVDMPCHWASGNRRYASR